MTAGAFDMLEVEIDALDAVVAMVRADFAWACPMENKLIVKKKKRGVCDCKVGGWRRRDTYTEMARAEKGLSVES